MIVSFKCKDTAKLFRQERVAKFRAFEPIARRKLELLAAVTTLDELRIPPGNRLEALSGDRKGQHSIRINGQFRLCFCWRNNAAHDVEIVDYHD